MNPIKELGRQLDNGWFSRLLVVAQFWIAWDTLMWAKAFASTALSGVITVSGDGKPLILDLMAVAANIGAVFLGPQALLFAATKFYMDARAKTPIMIEDRRSS